VSRLRARAIVSGRVQGVWFRESTRQRAEALGLSGWVRNLPDGRVEALLEGEAGAVREGLAFLRRGPPRARVDDLRVEEETPGPAPGPARFEVRF
jgi:acylphosphatase